MFELTATVPEVAEKNKNWRKEIRKWRKDSCIGLISPSIIAECLLTSMLEQPKGSEVQGNWQRCLLKPPSLPHYALHLHKHLHQCVPSDSSGAEVLKPGWVDSYFKWIWNHTVAGKGDFCFLLLLLTFSSFCLMKTNTGKKIGLWLAQSIF